MSREIGHRVGVLKSANDRRVELFGYGTYQGDQPSPAGFPNPKLVLDNGKTVWGYESWWGPEDKVKAHVDGYVSRGAELVDVSGELA